MSEQPKGALHHLLYQCETAFCSTPWMCVFFYLRCVSFNLILYYILFQYSCI